MEARRHLPHGQLGQGSTRDRGRDSRQHMEHGSTTSPSSRTTWPRVYQGSRKRFTPTYGAWKHDVTFLTDNLAKGLPGIEEEIHANIWSMEARRHLPHGQLGQGSTRDRGRDS